VSFASISPSQLSTTFGTGYVSDYLEMKEKHLGVKIEECEEDFLVEGLSAM